MPEEAAKQEPILTFPQWRWEGVDTNGTFLWMMDTTFQRYIQAWLETRGITHPTREQLGEAFAHCRKLSYWKGCRDPDVHFVSYQHALEQQKKTHSSPHV
jgi:hypothetical protein